MKRTNNILLWGLGLAVALSLPVSEAAARVAAQMQIGQRWHSGQWPDSVSSRLPAEETCSSLHWQPSQRWPLTLGVSHRFLKFARGSFTPSLSKVEGMALGVEVTAWHAFKGSFTPYVKARLVPSSKVKMSYEDAIAGSYQREVGTEGYHLQVGFKYRIIPIVSLMLEIGKGNEVIKGQDGHRQSLPSSALLGGMDITILDN